MDFTVEVDEKTTPTLQAYGALQKAFDHFNYALFDDQLPAVFLSLKPKRNALGYFHADNIKATDDSDAKLDEIALNTDYFKERTVEQTMSTLAHEMAHHWQQTFGKPGKGGYHNTHWCKKMLEIGLNPISANGEGLKATGRKVTHEIVEGGPFQVAFLEISDMKIDWGTLPTAAAKKPNTRKKIVCPDCGQKVWGVDKNKLMCGVCETAMVIEGSDPEGEEGKEEA